MDVSLTWEGGQRFRAHGRAGKDVLVDGETRDGVSPMEALLVALGSCMGTDVVDILHKGRQDVTGIRIGLAGTRREEHPRRFTAVTMTIAIEGRGVSPAKAERAVELSRATYCSVWNSMAADIDFQVHLEVTGSS